MTTKQERKRREAARLAAIAAAKDRVETARAELEEAGKDLLAVIGATDDEIQNAVDMLSDCYDDERASQAMSCTSEWNALVAGQVLDDRDWAEEDAKDAAKEARR
jgi:hypothetical protein